MIFSLKDLKYFVAFFLLLMLVDSSFAGFLPKAFEGDFVQTKKNLRSTRKAPVSIKYMYPKNIRMQVQEADSSITYVCNPDKTWIYTPPFMEGEKGHLREGASSKYCYSKIFDALKYGLTSNKHYEVKKLSQKKYQLNFVKTTANEVGFDVITINFSAEPLNFQNIVSLEMLDKSKKHPVILEKKKLKLVKSIDRKHFIFKIPPNTEIEKMQ